MSDTRPMRRLALTLCVVAIAVNVALPTGFWRRVPGLTLVACSLGLLYYTRNDR